MTDIVVTMPQGEIDHWTEKCSFSYIASHHTWWNMKRLPKNLTINDKVFVSMEGKVRGFFEVRRIKIGMPHKVFLKNFQEIKSITMRGFQGFRYRKFEYELE